MIEELSVSLPALLAVVIMSVTWAGSVAGVYFGLRNRIAMGEARMDRFKIDLDAGSARFAGFDARFNALEKQQAHHSERVVVVETLLSSMNDKLDNLLAEVRKG